MSIDPIRILIIEDDPGYADFLQDLLSENEDFSYTAEWRDRAQTGTTRLRQGGIDVLLLDLSLPDSYGLETFTTIHAQAPDVPIVIVSGLDDTTTTAEAVRDGAQDFLIKGEISPASLARTLRYAIERKQTVVALQQTRDQLRKQVKEQTRQLEVANEELRAEIAEHKQSETTLQRYTERLKVLQEIDRANLAARSPAEVATIALDYLRRLIPAHRTSVTLFDFSAKRAEVLAVNTVDATQLGRGEYVPLSAFPGLATMRQGNHYVTEALRAMPERSAVDERLLVEGIQATANIPLVSQGELIGSLNLGAMDDESFKTEHLEVAREVADQVAVAVRQSQLFAAAQRRLQESEAMAAVSQALNETLRLEQVLQLIANAARQVIPQAEGTVIHLLDEKEQVLQPVTVTEAGKTEADFDRAGLMMRPNEGVAGTVVAQGKLINVSDTHTDSRFLSHGESPHRSLLVAPIQSRVEIVGTITVQSTRPRAFSSADERLLSILGTQAALAIQNARLFEAEQQARRVAETLRAANQALTQTLDLDEVLETLLEYIFHLVPYDSANVMLLKDGTHVIMRALRGYERWSDVEVVRAITYDVQQPSLAPIFTTKQSVLIADTQEFPGWDPVKGVHYVRSWLGVPLLAGGEVIGLYSMDKAEPGFFTREHQQLAEALAAQAAVAVQNALLLQAEREQFHRLQQSQAQLIQAEKMGALGRLVASIAHEINNPIQAMKGCLTLTTEELDGDQDRESVDLYLGIIQSELDRVATIVRNLRDFYRPGRASMQPSDLHEILESVLKLAGKQLQQSDIVVKRTWFEDLPLVLANPDHLKQVFLNLVLNAIDSMPDGGTLNVRTAVDEWQLQQNHRPTPVARIEFNDTGIGMSPEVSSRLFEPFFTTKEHGSGLGLSISYSIIEAHNGEITVSSQVGVGTTFTILLPVTES